MAGGSAREEQPAIGGAVASGQDVEPGFEHDTFSSFYPLAAASPVIKALAPERFGLSWSHAPAVVGTPTADGGWAILHRDPNRTARHLDALFHAHFATDRTRASG
jgi:phytoene dehydrogenase-like protein